MRKKMFALVIAFALLFGVANVSYAQDTYTPDLTIPENGVAISNGDYNSSSVKANAFDDNFASVWASQLTGVSVINTSYIGFKFNSPKHIERIGISQTIGGGVYSAKVQRSDDEVNWIDVQEIILSTTTTSMQYFDIDPSQPATSWRLLATTAPSGLNYAWNLYEIEMVEKKPYAPSNLVGIADDSQAFLSWSVYSEPFIAGYNIYQSGVLVTTVTSATYAYISGLNNGTTYSFEVTAVKTTGTESAKSNKVFVTPQANVLERGLLTITLINGLEKEYDLSMTEINQFISWYENKQAGIGSASFAINQHEHNIGPFKSRKDYIIHDKILLFEVDEYVPYTP